MDVVGLNQVNREVNYYYKLFRDKARVNYDQYQVLIELASRGEVSYSEISKMVRVGDSSNLRKIVMKPLINKGLVEGIGNTRGKKAKLTSHGKKLVDGLLED
jgi:DNA-binding MarR family transcriptional regulator